MAMPIDRIIAAIDERLKDYWYKHCVEEAAAPVCVIAIKQLAGPAFGRSVVCMLEDMTNEDLAELRDRVAAELRGQ